MKRCKALILAAIAVFATPTFAEKPTVVITTGGKGGSYYNVFGVNLAAVLRDHGWGTTLETSRGSMENNERVGKGVAHMGFTQADAYALFLQKNPDRALSMMQIGSLGKECVYIAVRADGPVQDEDDIGPGTKVAVQKVGSGSAVTWEYLQTLEPDYAKASTFNQGGALALTALATGQLDAVLWVASPSNLNDKNLQIVRENPNLKLIDVNDWSLNNKLPNGEAIYSAETIDTKKGFGGGVDTVCTQVLVVANTELADEEVLEQVATTLAMNAGRITAAK